MLRYQAIRPVCQRQKNLKSRIRKLCRTSALALIAVAFGVNAAEVAFEIEPQRTDAALLQLAEAAEVQILFSAKAAQNTQSPGLSGKHSISDALEATLAGTGLTYEFKSDDFVVVRTRSSGGNDGAGSGEARGKAGEERRFGVMLARLQDSREEQEARREDSEEQETDTDDPLELSEQTVTGSRLVRGDPSARVYSLSSEDIARRGVSSIEELFRTLPWNFSSINTQTNGYLIDSDAADTDQNVGRLGLGTSTINLRALGSANTLVLVNGRRVAGQAGNENSLTNILNVPLSAIERVDIQLDGASAVYGADAIGGVVNFITKKNYHGFSATYREELSATDSDRRNVSLQGGYAWGTGNIIATLSHERSKPIDNFKLWTSNDFRDQFGPEFDLRNRFIGQPGVVCEFTPFYYRVPQCGGSFDFTTFSFVTPRYQLPAGHSGVGATQADFNTDITPTDYVDPQNGEDSTNTSFTVRVEQYLTDDLRVYADVLFSDLDSWQQHRTTMTYIVPASNAYNPFGRDMVVNYWPIHEVESGVIPPAYTESENKQRNYNAGLFWEFADGHQFEFNVTRSESKRFAWQIRTDWYRSEFDPTRESFYAALESSDPAVALNLFGDGTAQGSSLTELFTSVNWDGGPGRGRSEVTSFEPLLRGDLFRAWGGAVSYAIGAEFRKEVIYSHSEDYRESGLVQSFGEIDTLGVEKPTTELTAFFAELAIPIVGPENARPGVRSLVLSLQARRDEYTFEGAMGTSGLIETKKAATSPRIGFQYMPNDSIVMRAALSESFQPPTYGSQFGGDAPLGIAYPWVDPYHPSGVPTFNFFPTTLGVFNPEIKPEFSDNYSTGFEWNSQKMPGLRWSVDWSRIDFSDKIEFSNRLLNYHPEIAFSLPEIVQRDADGHITNVSFKYLNLTEKVSEILETTVQYAFSTRFGDFTPRLDYTRFLDEYFAVTPESDRVDRVGTAAGSDKYRLTASLAWTYGRWAADLWVRHIPSYENDLTGVCNEVVGRCTQQSEDRPTLKVDSMTTIDLTLTYLFDTGLRIRAGGRNLFEEESPTIWNRLPYDPSRWDARGRVLFLELNYEI